MDFKIRTDFKTPPFMVPGEIVDSHIKLAGALQLRVILYCLRHAYDGEIAPAQMAELFGVGLEDVNDALMFWCELGYLEQLSGTAPACAPAAPLPPEPKKAAPPVLPKPSRKEVARRGMECPDIAFLLNEAQQKFGRGLKQSESSALVWMFDDLGMDVSIILMVLEYARQAERLNISYIQKVAKDWADNGIDSISAAEKRIVELGNLRTAWWKLRTAFGLEARAPSETEEKLALLAVTEWKMSDGLLKKAYSLCIDSVGRYKIAYVKKVLTEWHKAGITNEEELSRLASPPPTNNEKDKGRGKKAKGPAATYDLSLLDEIINGD